MDVNTEALKTLIDIGGQAILLVLLWQVWTRLNVVTDELISLNRELRAQADERRENRAQDAHRANRPTE